MDRRLATMTFAVAALAGGCSLMVGDDVGPVACTLDPRFDVYTCPERSTCLGRVCIADRTLRKEETCGEDVQCAAPRVCSLKPNPACREPCSEFFTASSSCASATEYCRPYLAGDRANGGCVESECETDTDCRTEHYVEKGLVCVHLLPGVSACLTPCEIRWSNSIYTDTCHKDIPRYCQPFGMAGEQRLVCVDLFNVIGEVEGGQSCKPGSAPCASGYTCIASSCRKLCRPHEEGGLDEQCRDSASGATCCVTRNPNGERFATCEIP
jgi:hypothetical protein